MLMQRQYYALANRFGYALAFGGEPAAEIEADFLSAATLPPKLVFAKSPTIVVK